MNKLMLTISAGEWEGIQHRPHHFMRRSAKTGWTVIYLEPPATLIAPIKNPKMIDRWKSWLRGLRKIEEGIYLLSPPPTIPFGNKYRLINKINQWLIAKSVKKAVKNFPNATLDMYAFLPNAVDLLSHFNFNKVIYDCVDDHTAFSGLINADTVYQMEKELMEKADVSFATAKQLMEDRKDWSNNFHLIPNGAEYEHFAQTSSAMSLPKDIEQISQPVVGFVGGISDWIDIPLITNVAKRLPEYSFVLIGPVATNVESLEKLPNVYLLGSKPYQELPSYIQAFSTTLIPFKINKLTESVNPIKMYEYLSAGKPVVSTPLPEVLNYRDVVEIGKTEEEIVNAIKKTVKNSQIYQNEQEIKEEQKRIDARQQVGKENSWDARWKQAAQYIKAGQAEEKKEYVTGK